MGALLVDAVVGDGDIRVTDPHYKARRQRAAKRWGDGTALTVRIEPEEDAKTYGQCKYFYGYVVRPLVEFTGDPDWAQELKAMFMPDGKTSITDLSFEEMRTLTEQSEAWARERCPEAFELFGRQYAA